MTEAGRKLVAAARDGKFRDCRELMKLLPTLDFAEPPYCRTALWHAACRGHEAVTRLLLDRGASVNHQDVRGSTALHEAALHGQQQIAELLIERGASLDLPDYAGDTPLFLAVYARRTEIVALLLSKGADTNRTNNAGLTCFHLAGAAGSPTLASFLLYRGAYTNRFNDQEQKTLDEARTRAQDTSLNSPKQSAAIADNYEEAATNAATTEFTAFGSQGEGECIATLDEQPKSQEQSTNEAGTNSFLESGDGASDIDGKSPHLSIRSVSLEV